MVDALASGASVFTDVLVRVQSRGPETMLEFAKIFLSFFIYSFAGWLAELLWCSIIHKKAKARGVLFGPYCPIYGFGAVLVLGATYTVRDNWFFTFLVAIGLCSVLEYTTSFVLEKIFHIRWWDYSTTEKFNLNGRICLAASLSFGIFGIIAAQWVQPFIESGLALIPENIQIIIAAILFVIMMTDFVASMLATWGAKKLVDFSKIAGDQTAEVKKACKTVAKKTIKKLSNKSRKKS